LKRRVFERAVAHYKEAYNIANDYGSVYAIGLSENTDMVKMWRKNYHDAITRLLSLA
jgi:hypothetical protein